jgi:hypothetical protein
MHITGGVATVGRSTPRAVPTVNAAKPLGTRQPHVTDLGADAAGTTRRPHAVLEGRTVTFKNAAEARARDAWGDVGVGTPAVDYAPGRSRD